VLPGIGTASIVVWESLELTIRPGSKIEFTPSWLLRKVSELLWPRP
jgi:hypothetical protein